MGTLGRKLKAALALAAIGGAIGLLAGGVWGLVTGLITGIRPAREVLVAGGAWAAFGVLAGGGFGVFLAALARGRSLEDLSWTRVVLGGALAGASFPAVFVTLLNSADLSRVDPLVFLICASLGSGLSSGLVGLAKRAQRQELDPLQTRRIRSRRRDHIDGLIDAEGQATRGEAKP